MGWVVNARLRPLYPRERLGTHCRGPGLKGWGKSRPTRFWSPDHPARSESLYPAHPTPFNFTSKTNYLERKSSGLDDRWNSIDNETQQKQRRNKNEDETDGQNRCGRNAKKKLILKHCETSWRWSRQSRAIQQQPHVSGSSRGGRVHGQGQNEFFVPSDTSIYA
jgi:hypothetical protein